jgi:hypothetical protein
VAPETALQPASAAKLSEFAACHCHKKSAIFCLIELPIASERRITLRLCHNLLQDPGKHWLRPAFAYRTFGDVWQMEALVVCQLSNRRLHPHDSAYVRPRHSNRPRCVHVAQGLNHCPL